MMNLVKMTLERLLQEALKRNEIIAAGPRLDISVHGDHGDMESICIQISIPERRISEWEVSLDDNVLTDNQQYLNEFNYEFSDEFVKAETIMEYLDGKSYEVWVFNERFKYWERSYSRNQANRLFWALL